MKPKFLSACGVAIILILSGCKQTQSATKSSESKSDIIVAVQSAAARDCGCGECAAKGCKPCRGKNCYYCVAKALDTTECGCGDCNADGCKSCGPGCDVCKFHLAPVEKAKEKK